jgi:hypothetical protein
VVEGVDGAEGELDVALGVDVVGDAEGDFGMFWTSQSSSTTMMHLVNMAWPMDQMPFMTLRAWPA